MTQSYQPTAQHQTPEPEIGAQTPKLTEFWVKIVPHLFKTGLTRTSRNNGRTYPRATEQPLPAEIPAAPTANRIYGPDGSTHCIALDFDSSKGGPEAVTADHQKALAFLAAHGINRTISDISPNGGRHLYIPLANKLTFVAAKMITSALAGTLPTLDTSPMNGATDGVIRVPGSAHKSGGHQEPTTDLGAALMAVHIRNDLASINNLYQWAKNRKEAAAHTNPNITPAVAPAAGEPLAGKELIAHATRLPSHRPAPLPLFPEWAQVAQTGKWDQDTYKTASEARLAFTRACVRAGYTFATFLEALEAKQFSGAAKFWARYSAEHRLSALARDFSKAHSYKGKDTHVQDCNTRDHLHTPLTSPTTEKTQLNDSAYLHVRSWFSAVQKVEAQRYADSVGSRLVLRGLGAMVQRTGESTVAVGVRSLALATGLSASTVSRILVSLRNEEDPFIRMVSAGHGLNASIYELIIPQHLEDASSAGWFTGLIPAVDKAFFGLPIAAPLVYEALTSIGVSSIDLSTVVGLPVRTVQAVLEELSALGLAEPTAGGWIVGACPLARAATVSGGAAVFAAMVTAIRIQRNTWFKWVMGRATGAGYEPQPGDVGICFSAGQIYDPTIQAWCDPAELTPA